MPVLPGTRLAFSKDSLSLLEGSINELIDDLEDKHQQLFRDIDVWWDWAEAKPATQTRNSPWPNASNVVIPFSRIYSDAIIARLFGSMTNSKSFWHGSSRNEDFRNKYLPHIPDFLNWGGASGHEYDLHTPLLDHISECVPIGSSVVGLNWQSREQFIFVPNGSGKPDLQKVRLSNGPILEQIPREQVLWRPGMSIQQSDVVVRQYLTTYGDMLSRVESDGWDQKVVEEAKGVSGGDGAPAFDIKANKLERGGYDSSDLERLHDIREVWVEWPILASLGVKMEEEEKPGTPHPPITLTIHRGTRRILRAISKPYYIPGWPFYDIYFRRRSGQGSGMGVAGILDHLQRAATTMVNQTIDAVTLSNSIVGKTTDPDVLTQIFSPNKWLLVDNINEAVEFNLSKIVTPDIALINLMKTFAESLMGISDPALGRETRMGGHPSPATNFMGQIQQGAILTNHTLKQLRMSWSRVGMDVATLYQQYEMNEDGKIQRALGPADGDRLQEWLFPNNQPIIGNLELDIHALSETHNPDAERQKAIMVDQMSSNYWAKLLKGLELLANPQVAENKALSGGILKSMEAASESMKNFLETSDVDETEKYLFDLRQLGQSQADFGELRSAITERAGEVPGMEAGGALPPVPATPSGVQGPNGQSIGSGLG